MNAKPFVKWAGGKSQLIKNITSKFPYSKHDSFSYIEPFAGGGAVLFWVLNNFPNINNVVINDLNADLINAYHVIKFNVRELILLLEVYEEEYYLLLNNEKNKKQYYYDKRDMFNRNCGGVITKAALFIFLNKTCFNGLYRVNKNGNFNVPIGSYKKPLICDKQNLINVSKLLQKVTISSLDFESTYGLIYDKTLFYIDPPYRPLSKTSNFTSYSKGGFDDNDQIRLKKFCDKINAGGFKFILSNSDPKNVDVNDNFFDDLYKNYTINRVSAKRNINSKASRRNSVSELIISN